ncbi:hypothetical protein [Nocardioides marmotae]|uniref:hypothetical protein n=1 Tax=Nocardioides marmotae TaxID=2663857 RepID=UPI0012B5D162|nr:hypothetical protein [Nocardioides marmotae]MBC9731954.1 hypothetical protein [Nocardioides marmotae]MTB83075.1 hypothetical protein [Nocardioides marmotae]
MPSVPAAQPFRAFTLNVCYCLAPAKAMADVRKVLPLGDAGGLQEFSDAVDRRNLISLLTAEDWGWYMPTTGGGAIPIIWDRSRFRLLEGRTIKVHPAEKGVTPARYINSVRLREIATGEVYGIVNAHTIARASHDARLTDMRRIPRLRKHLQLMRGEIERLFGMTEHVFAAGDLNVNYLADRNRRNAGLPTSALADLVSFDMPLIGSRGTRSLLDYTLSVRDAGGLVATDRRVVRGFNSDHDAVVVTYQPQQLLADGPVFNDPTADPADRTAVRDRQVRAVRNAEPGEVVRLATARLDDAVLEQALLAAAAEGVGVRVVAGAVSPALTRLQAALGTDAGAASYALACGADCLDGGRHEVEALLVDRVSRPTDLAVVASAAAVPSSTKSWTTGFISTDPATYDAYGAVLDRLVAAAALPGLPTDPGTDPGTGPAPVPAVSYPVAAGAVDPVLDALATVGCATGPTAVRAVVRSWAGARGRLLADRLAELRRAGCDVAVVVGPGVLSGVRSRLTAGGVRVAQAKVAQTTLTVSGATERAWVGGPPWTDRGLTSTGLALEVADPGVVTAYLDAFTRLAPPA